MDPQVALGPAKSSSLIIELQATCIAGCTEECMEAGIAVAADAVSALAGQ